MAGSTTATDSLEWLKFSAFLLGGVAFIYLVYKLMNMFAPIGQGVADMAGAAGTVISDAADITSMTSEEAAGILGFDFSSQDPSDFPGYKKGSWQKLLNLPNDPFTLTYKMNNPASVDNPGPTAVKNWADALYNEMGPLAKYLLPGVNPDINKVFVIYQQIPDMDNVNLVYKAAKTFHNFDLAGDVNNFYVSITDPSKDIIASIILNKS